MPRSSDCAYFGCRNNRNVNKEIHFFLFPWKDAARCKEWIMNCGNRNLFDMEPTSLKSRYVCEKHFPADVIFQSGHRKLMSRFAKPLKFECNVKEPTEHSVSKQKRSNYLTSKMSKLCVVKSCPVGRISSFETSLPPGKLSFFQPNTPGRLESWSKALEITLKPRDLICQLHFNTEHINMYSKIVIKDVVHLHELHRKTLKQEAMPTIQHQFRHLGEQMLQVKQDLIQQQPEIIQHQIKIENVNHHSHSQDLEVPIEQNFCEQQSKKPLQHLLEKYQQFLPQHWAYIPKPDGIEYIRLDPETRQIKNHIMVKDDLTVLVVFPNEERMNVDDQIASALPEDVYAYLKTVEKWPLCVGTQIENKSYSNGCQGVIVGAGVYRRIQQNPRCQSCRDLRNRLKSTKGGFSVKDT